MGDRVKVWYDSEFTGLHRNTTLISIGLVSESGAYFYAEFNDYDRSQVDSWIDEHVIQNLQFNGVDECYSINKFIASNGNDGVPNNHLFIKMKGNKDQVRDQLVLWLRRESDSLGAKVQIYTDCYAYDWMLLMDLLVGNGLNTPDYLDYIPIDLSTVLHDHDIDPDVNREEFITPEVVEGLRVCDVFQNFPDDCKHNSLWDAYVCRECFLRVDSFSHREYTAEEVYKAFSGLPLDMQLLFMGIMG